MEITIHLTSPSGPKVVTEGPLWEKLLKSKQDGLTYVYHTYFARQEDMEVFFSCGKKNYYFDGATLCKMEIPDMDHEKERYIANYEFILYPTVESNDDRTLATVLDIISRVDPESPFLKEIQAERKETGFSKLVRIPKKNRPKFNVNGQDCFQYRIGNNLMTNDQWWLFVAYMANDFYPVHAEFDGNGYPWQARIGCIASEFVYGGNIVYIGSSGFGKAVNAKITKPDLWMAEEQNKAELLFKKESLLK